MEQLKALKLTLPSGLPNLRLSATALFGIVETALLVYLFSIAIWMMWQTGGAAVDIEEGWGWLLGIRNWEDWGDTVFSLILAAIFVLPIAFYWVLQARERHWASFWLVSILALAPQMPASLSYNQIDWLSLWRYPMFKTEISGPVVVLLLLVSLVLLVGLHRAADLRRLSSKLADMGLNNSERTLVVRSEGIVLGVVAGWSLAITGVLLVAGIALAQVGGPIKASPWPVISVGAGVVALLAMTVALWLRNPGSRSGPDPDGTYAPSPEG